MKFDVRMIAAAVAVTLGLSAPVAAATYQNTFSFVDTTTGRVLSGTLSGLKDGVTDGSQLTATVLVAPDVALLGTYLGQSGSFTAVGGTVTAADDGIFLTADNSGTALFGTDPHGSTFYPQVYNMSPSFVQAYNADAPDTFAPTPAVTTMFSFVDLLTGTVVAGTLSGLHEGVNDALGLTATVTSAPDAALLGNFAGNGGDFTVDHGVITSADAYFNGSGPALNLFFGSSPSTGYYSQLSTKQGDRFIQAYNDQVGTTFTAVSGVPEPATWVMLVVGFGAIGATMRRPRRIMPTSGRASRSAG